MHSQKQVIGHAPKERKGKSKQEKRKRLFFVCSFEGVGKPLRLEDSAPPLCKGGNKEAPPFALRLEDSAPPPSHPFVSPSRSRNDRASRTRHSPSGRGSHPLGSGTRHSPSGRGSHPLGSGTRHSPSGRGRGGGKKEATQRERFQTQKSQLSRTAIFHRRQISRVLSTPFETVKEKQTHTTIPVPIVRSYACISISQCLSISPVYYILFQTQLRVLKNCPENSLPVEGVKSRWDHVPFRGCGARRGEGEVVSGLMRSNTSIKKPPRHRNATPPQEGNRTHNRVWERVYTKSICFIVSGK